MKIVYVAGPLRGNFIKKFFNIRRAKRICKYLWENDVAVYSPHLNSGFIDSKETDRFILPANIEILLRCDAMYMIRGWIDSRGSIAEMHKAIDAKIPIYFSSKHLIDHYKNDKFKSWAEYMYNDNDRYKHGDNYLQITDYVCYICGMPLYRTPERYTVCATKGCKFR